MGLGLDLCLTLAYALGIRYSTRYTTSYRYHGVIEEVGMTQTSSLTVTVLLIVTYSVTFWQIQRSDLGQCTRNVWPLATYSRNHLRNECSVTVVILCLSTL